MKQETENLFQFVAEYNRKRMSKCSFLLVAAFCLGLFQTQTNATPVVPTGLTVAWASFHQVALAWEDDAETGLVYYNYRYFSPALGRWINRDPIGERATCNLYYILGNTSVRLI